LNKHARFDAVEVLEEDLDTVDKGVDSSCFRFRGLVLRTKLSVFFDTIESQGLVEQRVSGVLISCTSSSECVSFDICLCGVEPEADDGLKSGVVLFLDGILDPSGLNS